MTLHLFIDTTLCGASVAFVSNENKSEKIWTGFHPERGDADSAICRMVEEGLNHLEKNASDIDAIIVSHGPGSFTGIKVGLAWAYGFQSARKENLLVGMSSLAEGNAELQKQNSQKKIVLLLPISRREAFLCWEKNKEFSFSSIVLDSAESVLSKFESEGYVLYSIGSEIGKEITMLEFMKLAMQGMIRKAGTLDLVKLKKHTVVPQYLKQTAVEEKFALRNQNV